MVVRKFPDSDCWAEAALVPDETAFDVLRAVRCCRGTGIACIDGHLDGGCLSPSELVVLHGESSSAKSTLVRNVVASYIAAAEIGGHCLPAVLIDTEGTFDVILLTRLLAAVSERNQNRFAGGSVEVDISIEDHVEEALSRLLILRPAEPLDLLRDLYLLRDILTANPTTALLVVDSMSAWQSMASAFPRAVMPLLREAWKAILRLQQEHCLAAVVTLRDPSTDGVKTCHARHLQPAHGASCCHLNVGRHVAQMGEIDSCFTISRCSPTVSTSMPSNAMQILSFFLSEAGEVVSVAP
jgi:hypothetical protein